MNHRQLRPHYDEATMLPTLETPLCQTVNGSSNGTHHAAARSSRPRKQRVTITLPLSLLERLRNAPASLRSLAQLYGVAELLQLS